jgi:tRNA-Thr(GGU) m(6)t(6)A37 methyltransferase TsaA
MMKVKTIGYVNTVATEADIKKGRRNIISQIYLERRYVDGVKGLEEYSHIYVIYWMHRKDGERPRLLVRPRGRADLPEVGVFATRNPGRPNPIALTVVELIKIEDNVLTVRGLDALDKSPVLDIKPYDYYDIIEGVRVPAWFEKIWAERRD